MDCFGLITSPTVWLRLASVTGNWFHPKRTELPRLQPQSGLARFFEFGSERLLNLSKPKPHLSNPKTLGALSKPKTRRRVQSEAGAMMLVSPDGFCYVIYDTGPAGDDIAQLAERRPDLPSKRTNLEQMFGWKPSPHNVRRKVVEDWQLLQDVKWAERAGDFIPLVGSGANALKIFNQDREGHPTFSTAASVSS